MSARLNPNNGAMRISFPNNANANINTYLPPGYSQVYNPNPMAGLISPKSGQMYQTPTSTTSNSTATNRTFESAYDQLQSPTLDKNLAGKKSPYKMPEPRNTIDFRTSGNDFRTSNNFNSSSSPTIQNNSAMANNLRINSGVPEPGNYYQSQQSLNTSTP